MFLIILGALAGVAYWYFKGNPGKLEELKRKANNTVEGVKRNVPR